MPTDQGAGGTGQRSQGQLHAYNYLPGDESSRRTAHIVRACDARALTGWLGYDMLQIALTDAATCDQLVWC